MTDAINVHIYDVPYKDRYHAMDCAEHFAKQYPDRVGVRNLCVYEQTIAVYRTKTGRIVARGVSP